MGFEIFLQPIIGFGFAFHFMAPAMEIVVGPFVVRFGDDKWLRNTSGNENDDE